ncbi:cupin [Rhodobacter veldkampii DSM 11550]|uniref:Cupin n=1 Tax=Phaeovulum veldkampii DSM 11550 TaxID=1185920 RepID=A0A2T4JMB5_9RHOB|nr:cupin domain-containing protein [Phaeovulum veldkampii]MBK5944940.1 cupin [Phaeovulum veldkampii DSM 11550]NCU19601.1 cupin domain-containing protein [Candidatus Falkowbacteria bacterium]PTE19050.1 cupin [Phaeovulum veldkampii DSM 11550]TDQ61403.1 hypothetical protein EV658_104117 [Phaeovulum veldkampii DSM 11550]
MDRLILPLTPAAAAPETDRPAPEKVLEGDPVFTTWNVEERDGLWCGIWQSTPGTWRISYDEWEYCRILSGRSVIAGEDGSRLEVGPGDSFVLRPGFRGTWQVLETTRKDYVIVLSQAAGRVAAPGLG